VPQKCHQLMVRGKEGTRQRAKGQATSTSGTGSYWLYSRSGALDPRRVESIAPQPYLGFGLLLSICNPPLDLGVTAWGHLVLCRLVC
jgi:hypothetical protein